MKTLLLVLLVGTSLMVSGCGEQKSQTIVTPEVKDIAQKVVSKVEEVKAEVKEVVENVAPKAETVPDVQAVASDLVAQGQALVAEAKQYLEQGKLDEAIAVGQKILSIDPTNIDAQNIIDTASAKLKELATQKAGEMKSGLMNQLDTMGK